MTGLDPQSDRIVEAAVIVTNKRLEPVFEWESPVKQPREVLENMNAMAQAVVDQTLEVEEPNTLLLNDGQGNFTDGSARLPGTSEASFAARLVDVDGDQWPDLLVANLRGRQRLYLNAQGTFTDVTDQNLPAVNQGSSSAYNLAIGDFDGDRTTDVAFARRGAEPYLFLNIPR